MLHMKRTLDLDICKSSWDGNRIYVKDWNKLFKRKDYIRPNTRIMKFYIGDAKDCEMRRKKYKKRGFNIRLHPNFIQMENAINSISKVKYGRNNINPILQHVLDGTLNLESFDEKS